MCAHFVGMGAPFKTHVENGLSKIFVLWVQTIGVSNQAVFNLNRLSLRDEEGYKTNVRDPLTAA